MTSPAVLAVSEAAPAGAQATPQAAAQTAPSTRSYPVPGAGLTAASIPLRVALVPTATPVTANGAVVADVIARVNDGIITRGEYERSQQQLLQEVQQSGGAQADLTARENDLLRDMIDQQLLLSKGKELGITGDAETLRRLDEIRKQNHLESMEALEKAASQQGVSYEDFKKSIRNSVVTQQVVRDEVGRRLGLNHAQEEAYYKDHAKDFEQPEGVHLSEILVPTPESATDAQIAQAQAKADGLAAKLKAGAKFPDVAKSSSGGPTAAAGGDLGDFKRGTLGTVLEDATFSLPAGGETAPIRTRQGFVILRVDTHTPGGVPPLADVEPQVQEAIYLSALQPALRSYLSKARQEAFVDIKPGFVDTGTTHRENRPAFTAYAPPPPKKKTVKRQLAQQQRAQHAQEKLAEARQKVASKQASVVEAKAAGNAASGKPDKKVKIHREKVRYGQAPRNALPTAPTETADAGAGAPAALGQPAGLALSPTQATTSSTPGTGVGAATASITTPITAPGVDADDPLAPAAAPERKTRFSAREHETEEKHAEGKLVKAERAASVRPVAASSTESRDEKQQAAPLGLNGDTAKKPKKPKRQKGEAKERLQDKPKEVEVAAPAPAPTVNPATLGAGSGGTRPATPPANDRTSLPATTAAPGAPVQGQPIPAATSATPGAPPTTPVPPQ